MNSNTRAPINWWFISVATVMWLAASVMTLSDVWLGLWRSYPTSAGGITDQVLGRRQMMYGIVAFSALLFAYLFAPKRQLPRDLWQRYVWFGRCGVAGTFVVIALAQVIASGSTV